MKYAEYVAPGLLIVTSVAGFAAFAYVATTRSLTDLEIVLLQVLAASTGFTGTFMVGRLSATNAAKEIIEPHARSAFAVFYRNTEACAGWQPSSNLRMIPARPTNAGTCWQDLAR